MIIKKLLVERGGFVTDKEFPEVIEEDRFQKILVRTGMGRFICHAQDAQHFIKIIEREKTDHIRDVSIYREE